MQGLTLDEIVVDMKGGRFSPGQAYRIAGNVCGNYILRFVVKSKVCRFNVCGLHNTSLLMNLYQNIFADKMFAEFRQNRKPQNLIPRKHFRLYGMLHSVE